MRYWLKSLPGLGIFVPFMMAANADTQVCPDIMIRGDINSALSDPERYLVCGDSGTEEPFASAWGRVPRNQSKYFLRRFLEKRGFYHPEFSEPKGSLLVSPGAVTKILEVRLVGAPQGIELERHRKIRGRDLTPEALDELEQWVKSRLQSMGYPCAQLSTRADPDTGMVLIEVKAGPSRNFDGIQEELVEGLSPGILRRFDAFRSSDPYNIDYLRLTAERSMNEGTVLSTFFDPLCAPPNARFTASQSIVPGLPHILRFGFGANTEGLVLARATWRNTRLGSGASIFDVSTFVSTREQRLDSAFTWYWNPASRRNFLEPSLQLRHQSEEPFESVSVRAQLAPGTTFDGGDIGARIQAGPVWDFIKTLRGSGPETSRFLSLEARATLKTHYFEFFQTSPRQGAYSQFVAAFNDERFLSDLSAQRLSWNGEALWNWRSYYPPLLVAGLRWNLRTTVTAGGPSALASGGLLPANFRQFLGGIADLRGFGRNELPLSQHGGLTSGYLGLELRLANEIPAGIEPIVFLDAGLLGQNAFALEPPIYWSPGAGLRWATPFGAVRGTIAHGFLTSFDREIQDSREKLSHWQFYISLGEEF